MLVVYVVYVVFLAFLLAGVPCDYGVVESGGGGGRRGGGALFVAARREKDFNGRRLAMMETANAFNDDDDDDAAAAADASSSSSLSSSTLNSWIDFCTPSAENLFERPIPPILEADLRTNRQDPWPANVADRGREWYRRHTNVRAGASTKGKPKGKNALPLMLFGDSITEYWKLKVNREMLLKTLRLDNEEDVFVNGISGDETSHALYRLSHGAFPRTTVDDIVMMIGTNNFGRAYREHWDAKKIHEECLNEEQVRAIRREIPNAVAGVLAVIEKIRLMSPNSRIVVLGILPRGLRNNRAWKTVTQSSMLDMKTSQQLPDDDVLESRAFKGQFTLPNVFTKAIDFANDAVKRGVENEKVGGNMVFYRECGDAFLYNDEKSNTKMLNYDLMKDALHPDKPKGYEALGKCIRDILDSLPENREFANVRARQPGENSKIGVAT